MAEIGKILLIIGGVIVILGLILTFNQHIPFLGKLPGDILIKKDGFSFYFPIITFIILSILLTIIINVILHFLSR